jgi:uncharacterized membrane protein
MVKKKAVSGGSDERRVFAVIAYLLGIIGFLIVFLAKKDDKFALYHAKQSLVLFIVWIIIHVAGMIPLIGWFVIWPLGMLFLFILWVVGIINAATGRQKPLPVIGQFGERINL